MSKTAMISLLDQGNNGEEILSILDSITQEDQVFESSGGNYSTDRIEL